MGRVEKTYYEEAIRKGTFLCPTSGETIPAEALNDFSCDCADGSDERGTFACPHGHFWATNEGHVPLKLNASRVNDGICDACDGSDEYDGRTTCSNTCRALHQHVRALEKAHAAMVKEAMALKESYIAIAAENTEAEAKELDQLLSTISAHQEALEKQASERTLCYNPKRWRD